MILPPAGPEAASQAACCARDILRLRLLEIESREPEFYASVIKHEGGLPFSSEEWLNFLSKIPTRVFRDKPQLMNKLSEAQRERLPPNHQ